MTFDIGTIASVITGAFAIGASLLKVAKELGELTSAVAQATVQIAHITSKQELETERRIAADEKLYQLLHAGDEKLHERINYALLSREA